MKELNWFSGLLFALGIYSIIYSIVQFSLENWIPFLLILGLVIILDLFPMKLPNGIEYAAGSIGCLLILFMYGLPASILVSLISLFFSFVGKNKGLQNINWFRYMVSLGMYYIAFSLSREVIIYTNGVNLYLQVFLAALTFESVNHLLLAGIRKQVFNTPITESLLGSLKLLLIPILVYTFSIPALLDTADVRQWTTHFLFISVVAFVIIYFSTSFKREIERRHQAEQALRDAQQELLDTIRYQQGMTFKYKEVNGRFIHTMNDGELMYKLGFSHERIIGKELQEFLPGENVLMKEQYYSRAWAGEDDVVYEGEVNGVTYLASLRPIKRNGKVVEVIGSAVDITQRKKTEELLIKSEKLAAAGQLAAGLAHEVRNPLATIKGMVQLLQRGMVKEQYFELLLAEIDRMNLIIKEFLVLAKPYPVVYQYTNVQAVLEKVIALYEPETNMKNIQFVVDFQTDDFWIMGDENQLKQVFINIIRNSFDAMPDGGTIKIRTAYTADDKGTVTIEDTGCGIPEERLPKLGEPFFSNKEKGTGLGLMVTFKIIQEHKGSIQFESRVDEGTIVNVSLPLRAS